MINTAMEIEGKTTLVIKVDLSQEHGRSKSGKTITVASTSGATTAPKPHENIRINLNAYKYPE